MHAHPTGYNAVSIGEDRCMLGKPLREHVAEVGPVKAARDLGLSRQALSRAAESDREIFVSVQSDGTLKAKELSDFPAGKKKAAPD